MANDPGLLVMISLAGGPKHGHAILVDVALFAGRRLGPGTLYGAIGRLEAEGLIEPRTADGRRQPYELTEAGWKELGSRVEHLRSAVSVAGQRLANR